MRTRDQLIDSVRVREPEELRSEKSPNRADFHPRTEHGGYMQANNNIQSRLGSRRTFL